MPCKQLMGHRKFKFCIFKLSGNLFFNLNISKLYLVESADAEPVVQLCYI